MSVNVQHEFPEAGPAWMPLERCCFCRTKTAYWCVEKDVAVCQACAETHDVDEVPTKEDWCAREAAQIARIV